MKKKVRAVDPYPCAMTAEPYRLYEGGKERLLGDVHFEIGMLAMPLIHGEPVRSCVPSETARERSDAAWIETNVRPTGSVWFCRVAKQVVD